MTPAAIVVRVLVVFAFLRIVVRLLGARTLAQGTALDFVIALVLGDLVDDAFWAEVPIAEFVVAAGVVSILHAAVTLGRWASPRFARLVEGRPVCILRHGTLVRDGVRRERLGRWDVARLLRLAGMAPARRVDVRGVWIERSGEASVLREGVAAPAERRDAASLGGRG